MRLVHALGAAVAATTLVASVAKATVTASLVQIPVNSSAATAIGGTLPVRTFQLRVTQSGGEKWDVGSLKLSLVAGTSPAGYLYANPTVHSNTTGENKSYLAPGQTAADASFYDTYVTTPVFNATPTAGTAASHLNVVGSSDFPNTGPASNTPVVPSTATNTPGQNQTVNSVWGDQSGGQSTLPDGTYTVAQFTVVGSSGSFIRGYSGGSAAANTAQFFPSNAPSLTLPQGTMYLPILGDSNLDGFVDLADLNNVENNLGVNTATGDTNADGLIDLADLNNVENNLGNQVTPPATAGSLGSVVPEPTSIALLGLASLSCLRRRR